MDVNQKRLPSAELRRIIKPLVFLGTPIELLGSAGVASQRYYSDYDFYSGIDQPVKPEEAYQEYIKILNGVEKEPDLIYIESKIQRIDGTKTKFYPNTSLEGAGLFSSIKNAYNTVKKKASNFLSYAPSGLNNTSTKTLQDYGNIPIIALNVYRTPIMDVLDKALNLLSLGQWQTEKDKVGYDKLFHLALVATLQNGKNIVIEKNEVVNINTSYSTASNTETFNVPYNSNSITLSTLIQRAISSVSQKQFYDYNAFTNNCQFFIRYILQASNLYTDPVANFVFQDLSEMNLPSYVSKVAKGITRSGALANRLLGKGEGKREREAFLRAYHNVDYIKMDFIVRVGNIFKELSVIYSFNSKKENINIAHDMNTEIEDNIKMANYYKALKRLFSLYKIQGKSKDQLPLTRFFNSEVGRIYATVSNLKALQILLRHPNTKTIYKKIEINMKDLHLVPRVSLIPKYIDAYQYIIQREAKLLWEKVGKKDIGDEKSILKKMTVVSLRKIVKDKGLHKAMRGYTRWKKDKLVKKLKEEGYI